MCRMPAKTPRRFVVLLRGVNVGGRNKLPMALLRAVCESRGCTSVSTYIQSGNVVLESDLSQQELGGALQTAIDEAVGFTPGVVVRTADDIERALAANPYPDTPERERYLHIGFLSEEPAPAEVAELALVDCAPEGFEVLGKEIFLDYTNGMGQSKKLVRIPFERRLGVVMTARNLRTVRKLAELARA